jgi:hypothetical protein
MPPYTEAVDGIFHILGTRLGIPHFIVKKVSEKDLNMVSRPLNELEYAKIG